MPEEPSEACEKKSVVTAEAAEECCEEGLEAAKEFIRKTGESLVDAIRRVTASSANESSFSVTEKLLTEMWETG